MYSNILFLVIMTLAGITLMYYTTVFCRRMQFMGEGFPHSIVERMLGGEGEEGEGPTPAEVEEALEGLRRRLLLASLLLLALTLALLVSAFLLAWQFTTSSLPLILVGLAVTVFSASLSAVILRRNLTAA